MLSSALPLLLCVSATLGGSYAPAPIVEPSPSAYGSPYSYQQRVDPYGYPQQQLVEDTIYKEPVVSEVPIPIPQTPQPQTNTYPIQVTASQPVYEYPSTVYNDYDTTTVYTTTTTYAPVTEASEDEEQYGVPEIPSPLPINPHPSVLSAQESPIVSQPAQTQSYGVPKIPSPLPFNPLPSVLSAQKAPIVSQPAQTHSYAPPPLVQAAPSAYGAPVPSAELASPNGTPSSYGQPQFNELQFTAGELPSAVVVPGAVETLPTETYPSRINRKKIRAQKRFHKKH